MELGDIRICSVEGCDSDTDIYVVFSGRSCEATGRAVYVYLCDEHREEFQYVIQKTGKISGLR